MKKFALGFAVCAMCAFAESWTGYVSESGCGAKHVDGSEKSVACVKSCVKRGAAPVLVVDGKVLKVKDTTKVMDFLGQKVMVEGSLDGETVSVDKIEAAK